MFNHLQTFPNLCEIYIYNVIDVIFQLGNLKRKTQKVHMNNNPCKHFKNICFWDKEI